MELKSYHQFKGNKVTIDFDGMEFEQDSFFEFHKKLTSLINSVGLKVNLTNIGTYEENCFFDPTKMERTIMDEIEEFGQSLKENR